MQKQQKQNDNDEGVFYPPCVWLGLTWANFADVNKQHIKLYIVVSTICNIG